MALPQQQMCSLRKGKDLGKQPIKLINQDSLIYTLVGRGYPFKYLEIKQRPGGSYYVGIW